MPSRKVAADDGLVLKTRCDCRCFYQCDPTHKFRISSAVAINFEMQAGPLVRTRNNRIAGPHAYLHHTHQPQLFYQGILRRADNLHRVFGGNQIPDRT